MIHRVSCGDGDGPFAMARVCFVVAAEEWNEPALVFPESMARCSEGHGRFARVKVGLELIHLRLAGLAETDVKDKEIFATEVQLLKKLDHPNIIKLYEVYETEKTIYLVTEVCEGGELFYLIVEKKFLTEAQTAVIMRQIFSAIAYLHEHNICHRDLKPENILLKEKENIRSIKLIDFGIAKVFKEK